MKGTSSTARTAKAQAVLESSRGPNSLSRAADEIAASRGLLCYGRAAYAHAVAEISCERNSHIFGSAAQDIACSRGSGKIFRVANDQAGFVSCSALSPLAKLREA
eukprot:gnl/TRDRNA2_/TRDRNA2_177303_c1_seq4.p1 gnl/TRDRNA2_/TRDRNA2_177303_c1~~gnl/TRDRNA2_/TRDRNA2_177303_c1_seq4.p1  ORF type:complete len:105 (-),score=9.01 gnl/TRDRNA2_/TRDRNA2_177303_c1_seq4:189-503(-)